MTSTTVLNSPEAHLAEENVELLIGEGWTYVSKLSVVETVQMTMAGILQDDTAGTAKTRYVTVSGRTLTFFTGDVDNSGSAYVHIKGRL